MKKSYYIYITAIIALAVILPLVTRAEDSAGNVSGDTVNSAQTNTAAQVSHPGSLAPTILQMLRAKTNNIQNNEEIRNKMLGTSKPGSTTPLRSALRDEVGAMASSTRAERTDINSDRREEVQNIRQEGREDIKNASTSVERHEIRKDMRRDEFNIRKDTIVKQLNVTLNNLKQIRERLSSRIDKAVTEGRNMTSAKSLLTVADGKIKLAEQAINAVLILNPTATSTATASSTIDLGKPREIGNAAIKALGQARDALTAVIRAIAHSMGLGNASTTPPIVPLPATTTAGTTTTI